MAIISCPDCGNQVSSEADTCPKCGRPIKSGFMGRAGTSRWLNIGCLIVLCIVAAFGLMAMCARF